MAQTAKAETSSEPEVTSDRPLQIPPSSVVLDFAGQKTRRWLVYLPEGLPTADCLKTPGHWQAIQRTPAKAIRAFDEIKLIAFDGSWFAEAHCADSSPDGVVLCGIRITQLPAKRYDRLLNDGKYSVTYAPGQGFFCKRNFDGKQMSSIVQTVGMAERDLKNLYPQKV